MCISKYKCVFGIYRFVLMNYTTGYIICKKSNVCFIIHIWCSRNINVCFDYIVFCNKIKSWKENQMCISKNKCDINYHEFKYRKTSLQKVMWWFPRWHYRRWSCRCVYNSWTQRTNQVELNQNMLVFLTKNIFFSHPLCSHHRTVSDLHANLDPQVGLSKSTTRD